MSMSRKKTVGMVIVVAVALLLVPLAVALCRCELFSSNAEAGMARDAGDEKHCPGSAKKDFPCTGEAGAPKAHPCRAGSAAEKAHKCEHGSGSCCRVTTRPAGEADAAGEKVSPDSSGHGGLLKPSCDDPAAAPRKSACPYATGKEKQSSRGLPLYILHSSFLS